MGEIMTEQNNCACGRSPTGKCIGWHNLSEDEFKKKQAEFNARKD